jgi:hypothetical protein
MVSSYTFLFSSIKQQLDVPMDGLTFLETIHKIFTYVGLKRCHSFPQ